jgi:hypothetical protein
LGSILDLDQIGKVVVQLMYDMDGEQCFAGSRHPVQNNQRLVFFGEQRSS